MTIYVQYPPRDPLLACVAVRPGEDALGLGSQGAQQHAATKIEFEWILGFDMEIIYQLVPNDGYRKFDNQLTIPDEHLFMGI